MFRSQLNSKKMLSFARTVLAIDPGTFRANTIPTNSTVNINKTLKRQQNSTAAQLIYEVSSKRSELMANQTFPLTTA